MPASAITNTPAVIRVIERMWPKRRIAGSLAAMPVGLFRAAQNWKTCAAMSANPIDEQPTASYQADPASVSRVLLLYSGGLDTSVMLKWIQDSYEAEVVCLTVNLGQPGEDYVGI